MSMWRQVTMVSSLAALFVTVMGCGGSSSNAAAPFVGTWARAGSYIETCPSASPTTSALSGNLTIALGSGSDTIVATQPDNCKANYSVSGSVATAGPNQTCTATNSAGVIRVQTATTHTLTLSSDEQSLAQASVGSVVVTNNGVSTTCSWTSSGTYPKQ